MATVKESVTEALLGLTQGPTQDPQLSQQTRAAFMKRAIKDEETGEYYLGENEFIDAIAPESEDYVGLSIALCVVTLNADDIDFTAQNKAFAIRNPFPSSRSPTERKGQLGRLE